MQCSKVSDVIDETAWLCWESCGLRNVLSAQYPRKRSFCPLCGLHKVAKFCAGFDELGCVNYRL